MMELESSGPQINEEENESTESTGIYQLNHVGNNLYINPAWYFSAFTAVAWQGQGDKPKQKRACDCGTTRAKAETLNQ